MRALGAAGLALLVASCHHSAADKPVAEAARDAGADSSADGGSRSVSVTGAAGAVGASIAVVAGGTRVAVVNPDQGSVSFLDPDSLAVVSTTVVDAAGEPHTLLEVGKALLVADYRGGAVVSLDTASGAVTGKTAVCNGPYGLAASPDGAWVAVSCEWDGTVQRLDLATMQASPLAGASGFRRPRALAVIGASVWVADFIGGSVHEVRDGASVSTSLVPHDPAYRPALGAMTANLASGMAPAFGSLFVAHVLENNSGATTVEPEAEDYGSVDNTNPKINPSVSALGLRGLSSAPVLYAQYDGGPRVYSGPSAIASFGSHYLLVAHVSTANVAVLDTLATSPDTRSVGSFQVGFGPSGVAVDPSRNVAYVDNAFDLSVSRLDLSQPFSAPAESLPAALTLDRDLPSPFSEDAQAGRRLFYDATNPHVTPSGVVACASCHPGGSDDGLVWFIHTSTIPLKRRRTPHLANAHSGTAPYHWNGQFATMSDLVESTMVDLMAGDGLLVDTSTMQPFLDEVVKAPLLPVTDAAAVLRGQALFTSAPLACSKCHSGAYLTDNLLHTVLSPMSLSADDVIPESNTPGLHGVFLMAPYFHDGRAATLLDVLTAPYASGAEHTTGLSGSDVSDLVAYVNSL